MFHFYLQDPANFLWLHTKEPHCLHHLEIVRKHPRVTKLMGYEPLMKNIMFGIVSSPLFIVLVYIISSTANHNLFLTTHEVTPNFMFPSVWQNKTLAVFVNLPIGIPYTAAFKKYHIEHHKFLGQDGLNTNLPTNLELYLLNVFFAYDGNALNAVVLTRPKIITTWPGAAKRILKPNLLVKRPQRECRALMISSA
ncbi:Dihydroceramide delta(4)-desaturase [Leucoagaricus sp. SymC.cos]|nr:Dihydroceramide delta(4)-desaturase [Leucoagaricus sp. SymC.cos]